MIELKIACGAVVLVDFERIAELNQFTWRLDHQGYARRMSTINGRHGRSVLMHRVIAKAKKGEFVDHINGNPLDNRKENLRIVTLQQNSANKRKKCKSSSQFKGVIYNKNSNKWHARIGHLNKSKHLGCFDCEHAAGHAYNKAAIELFGEFACINPIGFPGGFNESI